MKEQFEPISLIKYAIRKHTINVIRERVLWNDGQSIMHLRVVIKERSRIELLRWKPTHKVHLIYLETIPFSGMYEISYLSVNMLVQRVYVNGIHSTMYDFKLKSIQVTIWCTSELIKLRRTYGLRRRWCSPIWRTVWHTAGNHLVLVGRRSWGWAISFRNIGVDIAVFAVVHH